MTDPNNPKRFAGTAPEIVVTQADRDAVQAFHTEMGRRLMSDIKNGTKLLDAKGEDSDPIYQAFARHRIEATRAKDAQIAGLELDVQVQKCLQDSAYRAGMKAGWNFCIDDNRDGYARAMAGTEHIAEIKRIRGQRATITPPAPMTDPVNEHARDQIAGLVEALERQTDNMAWVVNNLSLSDGWYDKFVRELAEDRAALATATDSMKEEG